MILTCIYSSLFTLLISHHPIIKRTLHAPFFLCNLTRTAFNIVIHYLSLSRIVW